MPKSEAERQADIRTDKAAWMNAQLDERLPGEDFEQPGVKPAKDAREDNVFPTPTTTRSTRRTTPSRQSVKGAAPEPDEK